MTGESSPNPAQVFEDFFGPAMFQPWAKVLIDLANPSEGANVLDLACATGTVARMVAPRVGSDGSVAGLDFSPVMLGVAQSSPVYGGPAIQWQEGDAAALPYDDGFFDVVISQHGLQFFPDREQSAREIYRVLKPGGRLVANVWQGTEVHPLFRALFEFVAKRLDAPFATVSLPFSLGDPDELDAYIRSGGFETVDVTPQKLEIEFQSADRFVQLSMIGAAAAIPAFGALDAGERTRMGQEIATQLASTLATYVTGDILTMPTAVNIVVAQR